jgi:hypothetical protein
MKSEIGQVEKPRITERKKPTDRTDSVKLTKPNVSARTDMVQVAKDAPSVQVVEPQSKEINKSSDTTDTVPSTKQTVKAPIEEAQQSEQTNDEHQTKSKVDQIPDVVPRMKSTVKSEEIRNEEALQNDQHEMKSEIGQVEKPRITERKKPTDRTDSVKLTKPTGNASTSPTNDTSPITTPTIEPEEVRNEGALQSEQQNDEHNAEGLSKIMGE